MAILLAGDADISWAAVYMARKAYYREIRGDIWGGNVWSLEDEVGGRRLGDRIPDDAVLG